MRFTFEPENESDRAEPPDASVLLWVLSILPPRVGRALQESAALGVFEALAGGPLSNEALAEKCGLAPGALPPLTGALINTRYVQRSGAGFELTELGRRWLLGLNRGGFADFVRAGSLASTWQTELPTFLQRGVPVAAAAMTKEARAVYEAGQAAYARARAADLLANLAVPAGATRLLDLGAAHGERAAAIRRKHPALSATVLDSPEAVEACADQPWSAAPEEGLVRRAADLHAIELGTGQYDVIVVSFPLGASASQSAELIRRCAAALKPGGTLAIDDFLPPADAAALGQQAAVHALFLSMTRAEDPVTLDEAKGWLRAAGLDPRPPVATAGALATLLMATRASSASTGAGGSR